MPSDPNTFPKVQFRSYRALNEQLLSRITIDAGYNERAKKMIERHLWLLTNEYERLSHERVFKVKEELAIFDACKAISFDEVQISTLETVVVNAFRARGLAQKWEVDSDGVVEKISNLLPIGKLALVDVAERFWALDKEQRLNNIRSVAQYQMWDDKLIQTVLLTFDVYGEAGLDLIKNGYEVPDWVGRDPLGPLNR